MATTTVTCIKNGRSDRFGRPFISGTTYQSVDLDLAKSLYDSGFVSVADTSVFAQRESITSDLLYSGVAVPILQCGLPFVIFAGDGGANGMLVAASGAFTLSSPVLTGLIIPQGYAYLPANAGGLGNAAGWVFFTMSSGTAGVLYNNMYNPDVDSAFRVPDVRIQFTNSSGYRVTQTTSEVTACTRVLKGGTLGPSGSMEIRLKVFASAGGSRSYFWKANGSVLHAYAWTSAADQDGSAVVQCTGAQNSQTTTREYKMSSESSTLTLNNDFKTLDFSVDQNLTISMSSSDVTASFVLYPQLINIVYGG